MKRLFQRLIAGIEWWAVALLVLMVGVVSLGVFYRYVVNAALVWYDEFASYLLVWLTFYGSVVASYRNRHIGFDIVVKKFSPAARRMVDFAGECFVLGFQAVLVYYGWLLVRKMGDESAISLPWVKMGWIYSVLPVTGALMLVISALRLLGIALGEGRERGDEAAWSGSSSE